MSLLSMQHLGCKGRSCWNAEWALEEHRAGVALRGSAKPGSLCQSKTSVDAALREAHGVLDPLVPVLAPPCGLGNCTQVPGVVGALGCCSSAAKPAAAPSGIKGASEQSWERTACKWQQRVQRKNVGRNRNSQAWHPGPARLGPGALRVHVLGN